MRLYPIDDPQHSEAADLLPWYANGTLDDKERAQVERHLADCIACKQDLQDLKSVQAMYAEEAPDHAAARALARARQRIARLETGGDSRAHHAKLRWWQVVLVGQAALILLLAAALLLRPDLHYYHTQAAAQGSAHGGGAGLVVIFDGARSEGELRDLLRSLDARVVDGPTAEGAYTLQVPAGEETRALSVLKQSDWVRFAEPALTPVTP